MAKDQLQTWIAQQQTSLLPAAPSHVQILSAKQQYLQALQKAGMVATEAQRQLTPTGTALEWRQQLLQKVKQLGTALTTGQAATCASLAGIYAMINALGSIAVAPPPQRMEQEQAQRRQRLMTENAAIVGKQGPAIPSPK